MDVVGESDDEDDQEDDQEDDDDDSGGSGSEGENEVDGSRDTSPAKRVAVNAGPVAAWRPALDEFADPIDLDADDALAGAVLHWPGTASQPSPSSQGAGVTRAAVTTACAICEDALAPPTLRCLYRPCKMAAHMMCLASAFVRKEAGAADTAPVLPCQGTCPTCARPLFWTDLVHDWRRRHVAASASQEGRG